MRPRSEEPALQSFLTPPGETLVAPEMLSDLDLPEGATPPASGGIMLPPLRVQAQLVPGVLVVDIGIAQRLLKMPDQVSRLLVGKSKAKRAAARNVAGDKLRLVEPEAESDLERLTDSFHLNLTAFGLLSFVVGLFIVNSAIGLAFEQRLPMLRTLRACGVSARMLNTVLVLELVSLALVAGVVGPGLRLSDRGIAAARCRRLLARTLWRANSRRVDAQAANGGSPASSSACSARWRRQPRALRRRSAFRCWPPRSPMPGNRRSIDG